jgi:redox-regulated HSP33 family molecular chaperone
MSTGKSFKAIHPTLDALKILQTIFSSKTIRLYDPSHPNFACRCSKKV